ncbi:MAG: DUF523 domain-containing protein [candidate division KSB1 bacterium]|nr:DUF523 domain-containing protein [candidate division KSB1 bacterium]
MGKGSQRILVSACLVGIPCRYDGRDAYCEALGELATKRVLIPVCPEQLGGLPTPRPAAQIHGGDGKDVLSGRARVLDERGRDVTENFLRGAQAVLRIAQLTGCREAILKARSPSCGCGQIYHGEQLVTGDGVTAALLKEHGIQVVSENGSGPQDR